MVFTLNETKPDDATSTTREKQEGDTYITVTEPELNQLLQPYGKHVIRPTEDEFASSIPQAHRKDEKAYHVKAHKGTKEGMQRQSAGNTPAEHTNTPQATSFSSPAA